VGLLLRFLKVPGEKIKILAFGDCFTTSELKENYTAYGGYFHVGAKIEGCEKNAAKPLILKKDGKIKDMVYPVNFDTGQGAPFVVPTEKPLRSYFETQKFSWQEGELKPDPDGDVSHQFLVEVYPGLPATDRHGNVKGFMRMVKFIVDPVRLVIKTNPKLIGHTASSEIFANAIRAKAFRWQIIATAIIMFLLGYAMGG